GNFRTLRDLIAAGHRPAAIRYHLASVNFRKPLNFTAEGLHQAQQSIDRLRNFRSRVTTESFDPGQNPELGALAAKARQAFERAMDENLNTAEALAAVFDLVRETNAAMDQGRLRDGDRAAFLEVLQQWDRIFAVIEDTDYARLREFGLLKTVE